MRHISKPVVSSFVALLVVACFVVLYMTFVMGDAAGDAGEQEPVAAAESACRTAWTVGKTITKFSSALARGDVEQVEGMLDPESFKLVSVQGPAAVIPMVPGVRRRPVRNPRDPKNYRGITTSEPQRVLEFMRDIGRIPFRLKRISVAPQVNSSSTWGKFVDFSFTGRGAGRPAWRRDLEVSGKGAIDCDGTTFLFIVVFRGGNTGVPSISPGCSANRTLTLVSGARICTRSRSGYRFWNRREAKLRGPRFSVHPE